MITPRRRVAVGIVSVFGAFVALVAFIALAYLMWGNPLDPFDDRRFSPVVWQRADAEVRARMARGAIRDHLSAGVPVARVVSVLGGPDEVLTGEDDGGHALPGAQTYSYHLGSWSAYGFDAAYLYVHLDAAGRVLSAEINGY